MANTNLHIKLEKMTRKEESIVIEMWLKVILSSSFKNFEPSFRNLEIQTKGWQFNVLLQTEQHPNCLYDKLVVWDSDLSTMREENQSNLHINLLYVPTQFERNLPSFFFEATDIKPWHLKKNINCLFFSIHFLFYFFLWIWVYKCYRFLIICYCNLFNQDTSTHYEGFQTVD